VRLDRLLLTVGLMAGSPTLLAQNLDAIIEGVTVDTSGPPLVEGLTHEGFLAVQRENVGVSSTTVTQFIVLGLTDVTQSVLVTALCAQLSAAKPFRSAFFPCDVVKAGRPV